MKLIDYDDVAEREKMLSGQAYNRGKFSRGGKSLGLEREYRNNMGYDRLRKPYGGVNPYLIDADGSDITPENSPESIENRIGDFHRSRAERNMDRYVDQITESIIRRLRRR